jgi:hypothetical protein
METVNNLTRPGSELVSPIDISFSNITYEVDVNLRENEVISNTMGKKAILNNISGIFKSG